MPGLKEKIAARQAEGLRAAMNEYLSMGGGAAAGGATAATAGLGSTAMGLAGKLGLGFLALQGAQEAGNFATRLWELNLIRKQQAAEALANAQLISQDAADRDLDRRAAAKERDAARSERAQMMNLADKQGLMQLLSQTANATRVQGIGGGMPFDQQQMLARGDAQLLLAQSQPSSFYEMLGLH